MFGFAKKIGRCCGFGLWCLWRLGVRSLLKTLKFDAEHPLQVWLPQLLAWPCCRSLGHMALRLRPSVVDDEGPWDVLGLFQMFRCN